MTFDRAPNITEHDVDFYYANPRPPLEELRQARIERYSIPKNRGENRGGEKTRNRMDTSLVEDRDSKNYRCSEQGSAMSRHRGGDQAMYRPPIRTDTPLAEDSNNRRRHHPKAIVEDPTIRAATRRGGMAITRRYNVLVDDSVQDLNRRVRRVTLQEEPPEDTVHASPTVQAPRNKVAEAGPKPSPAHQHPPLATPAPVAAEKLECLICTSDVLSSEAAHLTCGHDMCHDCLKRIFELSAKDEQLMPPRCCTATPIAWRHVVNLFDDDFKARFNEKKLEFGTKNRLYCPEKRCARWIKPQYIEIDRRTGRRKGFCRVCNTDSCGKCKQKWHGSSPCGVDKANADFARMATREAWQKCYNCEAMVELSDGCNHIRCTCGAEFCYRCGERWRTCGCPLYPLQHAVRTLQDVGDPAGNLMLEVPQNRRDARVNLDRQNERYANRHRHGVGEPQRRHVFDVPRYLQPGRVEPQRNAEPYADWYTHGTGLYATNFIFGPPPFLQADRVEIEQPRIGYYHPFQEVPWQFVPYDFNPYRG